MASSSKHRGLQVKYLKSEIFENLIFEILWGLKFGTWFGGWVMKENVRPVRMMGVTSWSEMPCGSLLWASACHTSQTQWGRQGVWLPEWQPGGRSSNSACTRWCYLQREKKINSLWCEFRNTIISVADNNLRHDLEQRSRNLCILVETEFEYHFFRSRSHIFFISISNNKPNNKNKPRWYLIYCI